MSKITYSDPSSDTKDRRRRSGRGTLNDFFERQVRNPTLFSPGSCAPTPFQQFPRFYTKSASKEKEQRKIIDSVFLSSCKLPSIPGSISPKVTKFVSHRPKFLNQNPDTSPMPRNSEPVISQRSTSPSVRVRARGDPFLAVCRCFSLLTGVTAVLCVCVNGLAAVRSFKHGSDIFGGILRCYALVIALFVAAAETEWAIILRFWNVLEYWVARGMLQIFVAVMTRAFPDFKGESRELIFLQELASYLLLACGLIYVISGVLCIGCLKRARMRKEITREQAAKDLEELERRRQELEALLIAERA